MGRKFTAADRAKAAKTRAENKLKNAADAYVKIGSTDGVTNPREKELLDEINALKSKLGIAENALTEAEQRAVSAVQQQGMGWEGDTDERPTGEFVEVQRLDKYKTVGHKEDGRPILNPVFKTVKLPTYAYRINMPPVGGIDMKINEVPFYHGGSYVFDIDTLRTVKDMVWKLWAHEKNIHGTDENAYRPKTNRTIGARGFQ